ncbi:MAG: GDSL-type esterase/lipase family protein [Bacteroidia bacterium]|nr:GDSL-type esterase/lipase family protein [Bacteroidia bacterium]
MKKFIALLCFVFVCNSSWAQREISLYEGKAPGSEDWTWSEQVSTQNPFYTKLVYNVAEPTITAYLPPYYLATGTAVIIAPGGAFHVLSIESEGHEVAKWLNSKGIAAFVLKYRLTRSLTDKPVEELAPLMSDFKKLDEKNAPTVKLALADGLTAIKYVREHAKEFDVNPDKIGFMGFSAGATLCMSVAYNANEENRPNFIAPIYPYENAIIGSEVPNAKTPIFVAVAGDDQLKLMPHSLNIYQKWFEKGQPAELHVYEKGGHGFGMRKQNLPTDSWHDRFWEWLQLHGYHKKLYPNKYEKLYGQEAVAQGKIDQVKQMQNDYAQLARYKEANSAILPRKNGEERVVFLGNSITEAWARDVPEFFEKHPFIGRGISGQTSTQLLLRFRQDVVELQPNLVVLHIGTNDVAENTGPYDPEFTMSNIISMVEIARANGIKVLLASVLPATKFEWKRALGDRSTMILDLNDRIKSYANKEEIPYVDYHSAMKNEQNGMDPDIAADGVHPSLKGYGIMKSLVLPIINTHLK